MRVQRSLKDNKIEGDFCIIDFNQIQIKIVLEVDGRRLKINK